MDVEEENTPANKIITELREIQEEYSQLSELEEMERNYADKLVDSLKVIQASVEEVIPVDKSALGPSYKYVKEAYLTRDAVVVLMNASGIQSAIPLSNLKSGEILAVVQNAAPHLKKIIADKRSETGDRVELLEKVLKEIKKAGKVLKEPTADEPVGRKVADEEDLISSALAKEA